MFRDLGQESRSGSCSRISFRNLGPSGLLVLALGNVGDLVTIRTLILMMSSITTSNVTKSLKIKGAEKVANITSAQ